MTTTQRRTYKGLVNGRVTWNNAANLTCLLLAQHGLHADVIAKQTGLSVGQVHYRCKKQKLHLRSYRDGNGAARRIIAQYSVSHIKSYERNDKEINKLWRAFAGKNLL